MDITHGTMIAIGVIMVIGMFWDGMRLRKKRKSHSTYSDQTSHPSPIPNQTPMAAPTISSAALFSDPLEETILMAPSPASTTSPSLPHEEIVAFNITARSPSRHFSGLAIQKILENLGCVYNDAGLFEGSLSRWQHPGRIADLPHLAPDFQIASLVEPGTFELDEMASFTTPGLIFFYVFSYEKALTDAPYLKHYQDVFEAMLQMARSCAQALNGDLKDAQRQSLSHHTIEQYRQRMKHTHYLTTQGIASLTQTQTQAQAQA